MFPLHYTKISLKFLVSVILGKKEQKAFHGKDKARDPYELLKLFVQSIIRPPQLIKY